MFSHQTKFSRLALVVSCFFALLAASAPFAAAEAKDSARLSGVVRNSAKTPIAGVTVTAVNQVTTERERTKTDSSGRYSFKLDAGAYRVMVEAADALPFDQENVIVEGGADKTFDIELKPMTPEAAKGNGNGAVAAIDPTAGEAPLVYEGPESVESRPPTNSRIREVRDRWRINFPEYDRYGDGSASGRDIPFRRGHWYNPYDASVLKGDLPIFGNKVFMVLSAFSKTLVQQQRTPIPSNVASARPGSAEFFGEPEVFATANVLQVTFEMFHGDTTFRPRNWAIKISPTFSLPNYVDARETGIINVDPRRGTNRADTHFSLEDAFAEVKFEDTNANFDFISARVGIQPFVSDFRGFLYTDSNLGARLFGAIDNNRYQFNAAFFSQLEKDTNSGLNRFDTRRQEVYIANIFRQDFIEKGFTGQLLFAFNHDRDTIEFDRNGFQVRPALIGDNRPHSIKVGYVGFSTDGHIKRINLTSSYFLALGRDTLNPIAGKPTNVRAQMAAAEASIDFDYVRYKTSFFFASGDKDPTDSQATGFDGIIDDPNFAGGQFSYWNRTGIPLTQTAVGLTQPLSLLPNLRSSKTQGQANFVNPGIFIYNIGADVEVTQKIKTIFNVNYLRFHRTESLEYLLFQNAIRKEIGYDLSVGVVYRPLLINNIQFTFGASTMFTGRGFRDIFTNRARNCPPEV
ncbi:MAG: carboxypeptidase-like regulatory domain-containing protein, partial [Pyrinomonadaceae bacterium]